MAPTWSPVIQKALSLGASARASLLWGGGFTLLRDVAQFAVMIVLVRLLSPSDYGTAAFAQAVFGVVSVLSYSTFSLHTLQARDPERIDWQAHFTAAAVLNTSLAGLVLALAGVLTLIPNYREAALPLAALAAVLLIEVPATLRARMLESKHDWRRYRLLLTAGTLLSLGVGLIVALMGGGVWALVVQIPILGLPAAIDLFLNTSFRPDWTWSWIRSRDTVRFGLDRIGSGIAARGRVLNEQILLSNLFGLATLGIFTRATGLAMLLAGRIGSVTMMSLHPVVTRAERGSVRFRRLADLVLRGICWTTVPAAAFLGLAAGDVVLLLYGAKWVSVVPLLPLAAVSIGMGGITTALASLLVANEDSRAALSFEVVAALSSIAVAVALVPMGVWIYLAGLSVHATVIASAATALLLRRKAISTSGLAAALVPPIFATLVGAMAVAVQREAGVSEYVAVRLVIDAVIFGVVYLGTLRALFATQFANLLAVAPGGANLARMLRLNT